MLTAESDRHDTGPPMTSVSAEEPTDRRTDWLDALLVVILAMSVGTAGAAIAGLHG